MNLQEMYDVVTEYQQKHPVVEFVSVTKDHPFVVLKYNDTQQECKVTFWEGVDDEDSIQEGLEKIRLHLVMLNSITEYKKSDPSISKIELIVNY